MTGVPDAFAQLLDKLVENAVDFAPAGTPVRISLASEGKRVTLAVENEGPALPAAIVERLFASMVSLRDSDRGAPPGDVHLGLGLYIVRLVAEFHGGRARALNLEGGRGVRFEVEVLLP
jgi:signal transduction histidine kinase